MQVTHPLRFPTRQGNYAPSSLRSLAHTLVPYPQLHFLSLNHVPSWQPAAAMTPRALVDALYYCGNLLAPREQWMSGRLLASHAHFQLEPHISSGVVSDIEEPLAQMHEVTTTVAAEAEGGEAELPTTTDSLVVSCCMLVSNSTSVRHSLETSYKIFNAMFVTHSARTMSEYAEASSRVHDLAVHYQQEAAEYDSGSFG